LNFVGLAVFDVQGFELDPEFLFLEFTRWKLQTFEALLVLLLQELRFVDLLAFFAQ